MEEIALAQIGVDPILYPDLSGVTARARGVLELNAARRWNALVELIPKHLTFFIFDLVEF